MGFGGVVQPCASHSEQPRIGASLIVSLRVSAQLRSLSKADFISAFLFVHHL